MQVHSNGLVRPEELKQALRDDTALVTVMYANNEIGTLQPIAEIGAICRERGVLFHTNAVQAVTNVPIDVKQQQIDLLSLSAHKFHGPKGVGVLYCRKGILLPNLIDGGAQERGKRAGTENVAGIVGLAQAMKNACAGMQERSERLTRMRDRLIGEVLKIERSRLNGDPDQRLPGNVNFCFEGRSEVPAAVAGHARHLCMPPAPPAPPGRWTPATCCSPSACRTQSRTARCGCPSATRTPRMTSTPFSRFCPASSPACVL